MLSDWNVRKYSTAARQRLRIGQRMTQVHPHDSHAEDPSRIIKYIIFFVNVLFWFLSILVLGIGIFVMVEKREVYSKLTDLYYDPAILFVVFGGLMFIITFTGCIGALRENTCLLAFYAGIITVLLIMEVVCGIVGFINSDKLEEKVDEKLQNAILFYRDPNKPDLHFLIDSAQTELGCCGSRSYTDWQANIYFNCTAPSLSACGVPFSCCKTEDQQTNRQCGYGVNELSPTKRQDLIHMEGCLNVSVKWFKDNLALIGGLSFGVVSLQLVTVCLAAMFRRQILDVKQQALSEG